MSQAIPNSAQHPSTVCKNPISIRIVPSLKE